MTQRNSSHGAPEVDAPEAGAQNGNLLVGVAPGELLKKEVALKKEAALQEQRRRMDPLTTFRTAYLRSIAQAWIDEKGFRRTLLSDPKAALARFGLSEWPWPTLDLVIREEEDLVWTGDSWAWPRSKDGEASKEDKLTLYVPLTPEVEPGKHAIALADYYRTRPSLLDIEPPSSVGSALKFSLREILGGAMSPFEVFAQVGSGGPHPGLVFNSSHAPKDGFIPSRDSFLNFEAALLSVMAKAWENKNFAAALQVDAVATLATVRGYKAPWELQIEIKDDLAAKWSEDGAPPWSPLKNNVLQLSLPSAPEEGRDQTIALAAFNTTGAEYPFTCCP